MLYRVCTILLDGWLPIIGMFSGYTCHSRNWFSLVPKFRYRELLIWMGAVHDAYFPWSHSRSSFLFSSLGYVVSSAYILPILNCFLDWWCLALWSVLSHHPLQKWHRPNPTPYTEDGNVLDISHTMFDHSHMDIVIPLKKHIVCRLIEHIGIVHIECLVE